MACPFKRYVLADREALKKGHPAPKDEVADERREIRRVRQRIRYHFRPKGLQAPSTHSCPSSGSSNYHPWDQLSQFGDAPACVLFEALLVTNAQVESLRLIARVSAGEHFS